MNRILHSENRPLIALCVMVWILSALGPEDRLTWLLEQIATVLVITVLMLQTGVVYSRAALTGLALLFCAHTIGTHYTYSLVPYDAWLQAIGSGSLNELMGWERNQYDRLVHVLWGLCLTQPICETLEQRLRAGSRAASHLSLHIVLSTAAIYELLEWAAAMVFGDGGLAYVGAQGDFWDAQADIAVCLIGWLVVMLLRLLGHSWNRR